MTQFLSSSSLALQPNAGLRLHNGTSPYPSIPWLLLPVSVHCIGFIVFIKPFGGLISGFLTGSSFLPLSTPRPTPNLEDQVPYLLSLRLGDPAIPQALSIHFGRLLRHACATWGLFLNPGHQTGWPNSHGWTNFRPLARFTQTWLSPVLLRLSYLMSHYMI